MSTKKLNIFPTFGLALKEALLRQKKSPAWLSRITGKDKGQISRYINGASNPRGLTLVELTHPLDYEIAKLDKDRWQLVEKLEVGRVAEESTTQYIAKDYKTEKAKLEGFFEMVDSFRKLFDESDQKSSLTDSEKLLQIEMIREKLRSTLDKNS